MEYMGSDSKPIVKLSEKQVSDFPSTVKVIPAAELEAKKVKAKSFNLLTVNFDLFAHKINNKRENAKQKGLLFEVNSIVDVLEVINKSGGLCGYTGRTFPDSNSVTFERVDPNIGYTISNTIFTTTEANNCKSNLDSFEKNNAIPDAMKIKLMNKAIYRLTKKLKAVQNAN